MDRDAQACGSRRGISFLDTAECTAPVNNEELVGRVIHGPARKVFLATKFGIVRGAEGRVSR